jgi:hypothetical protein
MPSSGMRPRVAVVTTDISQEYITYLADSFRSDNGSDSFLQNVGFLHEPHGETSQKMTFFVVTAVKTSNLT